MIGGTSLAGGVGTIYGAILGALVMQSLQIGMALLGVDDAAPDRSSSASFWSCAVWIDQLYRKRVAT